MPRGSVSSGPVHVDPGQRGPASTRARPSRHERRLPPDCGRGRLAVLTGECRAGRARR